MLQPRHRPDKENQIHRLPKTPGPSKSIVSKNPLKTPFHEENHTSQLHGRTTTKKSVAFGQSVDTSKFDAFQTPGLHLVPPLSSPFVLMFCSPTTNSSGKRFEY